MSVILKAPFIGRHPFNAQLWLQEDFQILVRCSTLCQLAACYAGSGNDGGATLYFVAVMPRQLSIGAALCLRPFHTKRYHTGPYYLMYSVLCQSIEQAAPRLKPFKTLHS